MFVNLDQILPNNDEIACHVNVGVFRIRCLIASINVSKNGLLYFRNKIKIALKSGQFNGNKITLHYSNDNKIEYAEYKLVNLFHSKKCHQNPLVLPIWLEPNTIGKRIFIS